MKNYLSGTMFTIWRMGTLEAQSPPVHKIPCNKHAQVSAGSKIIFFFLKKEQNMEVGFVLEDSGHSVLQSSTH